MPDQRRLALTLSGGGFRATLFHLGVVRFLLDGGLLPRVRRIAAVSGGSVLAAHLVLNWQQYISSPEAFDRLSGKVVRFVRSDVRGRVVRRWILAWMALIPRAILRRRWTFTQLLERQYERLYNGARLEDLNAENVPQVFFNCTSLSTGSPCCFGRSGFMWYDESDNEFPIVAPETKVAFAVAASSAFPPLFPPIEISHEVLSCDQKDFPNPHSLTDGGVYDNLGIDRLVWYHRKAKDIDLFLMSDAEGNFDWKLNHRFKLITARNIRASDLLMKRVSELKYSTLASIDFIAFKIGHEIASSGDTTVLSPGTQRMVRNIRTDLDAFSPNEIRCLVQHGYTVAREVCIDAGLADRRTAPAFPWDTVPGVERTVQPSLSGLKKSGARRLRLVAFRDWTSWVTVLLLAAFAGTPVYVAYKSRQQLAEATAAAATEARRAEEQAQLAAQLGDVNRRLTDVAVDYFKQRHRPIGPGMSISSNRDTASTICCIVQQRSGGAALFVLINTDFSGDVRPGSSILQPGAFDGGMEPQDVIARLRSNLLPERDRENTAAGAVAELSAGISATNLIPGFGPIQGVAETVELGQELFIAGRTTGLGRAVVDALDVSAPIALNEGVARFQGLISLRSAAGAPTRGGDSGAPVLTADGRLVAMVFAGSPEVSLAIPITRVFDALQVKLPD